MAANLKVEWSDEADSQLAKFHDQVLELWGKKEAEHFLDLAQEFERLVSLYPKAIIKSKKKRNIRLGLIHRHVSAIYQIEKHRIIIITLIDNRSGKAKSR
jgi:plasmid stabilization system protein ParE